MTMESSDDILELHAIIRGAVQGVCFRAAAQEHAQALQLCGTVRNCPDGSVELVAQGSKQHLEALLASIRARPGYGSVDTIDVTYRPVAKPLEGFRILRL